jgi:hypothetical protein
MQAPLRQRLLEQPETEMELEERSESVVDYTQQNAGHESHSIVNALEDASRSSDSPGPPEVSQDHAEHETWRRDETTEPATNFGISEKNSISREDISACDFVTPDTSFQSISLSPADRSLNIPGKLPVSTYSPESRRRGRSNKLENDLSQSELRLRERANRLKELENENHWRGEGSSAAKFSAMKNSMTLAGVIQGLELAKGLMKEASERTEWAEQIQAEERERCIRELNDHSNGDQERRIFEKLHDKDIDLANFLDLVPSPTQSPSISPSMSVSTTFGFRDTSSGSGNGSPLILRESRRQGHGSGHGPSSRYREYGTLDEELVALGLVAPSCRQENGHGRKKEQEREKEVRELFRKLDARANVHQNHSHRRESRESSDWQRNGAASASSSHRRRARSQGQGQDSDWSGARDKGTRASVLAPDSKQQHQGMHGQTSSMAMRREVVRMGSRLFAP